MHAFWLAPFRDRIGLRRDIPDQPMRKHSARRIWIIGNQNKSFSRSEGSPVICKGGLVSDAVTCEF